MRIATYNLNNLFIRTRAFELQSTATSKAIQQTFGKVSDIIQKPTYTAADKQAIKNMIELYVEKKKANYIEGKHNNFITVQQVRSKLYTKPTTGANAGQIVIKANGRADWEGWLELTREGVSSQASINTATVVQNVNADIVCCVEVENRLALEQFNENLLDKLYTYNMVIDGNDDRGIDVGVLSKHPIAGIETHIFDQYKTANNRYENIFSRDCAIYQIKHNGHTIHLLCNHFKSKIGGGEAKRQKQAEKVADILKNYNLKTDYVIVAGDLNATPDEAGIQKLTQHPNLHNLIQENIPAGQRSTYQLKKDEQIDYLLVSKALNDKLVGINIDSSGIFKATSPVMMPQVTDPTNAASDHAMVYADFNL